jgi:hypothetical protein
VRRSGLTPEVRADHDAYIGSWLKVLKADKRAVFTAAAHTQRAADFLHGRSPPLPRPLRPMRERMPITPRPDRPPMTCR